MYTCDVNPDLQVIAQGVYQLALRDIPGFTERLKELYVAAMEGGQWNWTHSFATFSHETYWVSNDHSVM